MKEPVVFERERARENKNQSLSPCAVLTGKVQGAVTHFLIQNSSAECEKGKESTKKLIFDAVAVAIQLLLAAEPSKKKLGDTFPMRHAYSIPAAAAVAE